MNLIKGIATWISNKYLVTISAFVVWMLFFDTRDMLTQRERSRELEKLKESKAYFSSEIEKETKALQELKSDPAAIEKLAREKYFMKKDNEDLFIIQNEAK
jgi:cell division protein DivIC